MFYEDDRMAGCCNLGCQHFGHGLWTGGKMTGGRTMHSAFGDMMGIQTVYIYFYRDMYKDININMNIYIYIYIHI